VVIGCGGVGLNCVQGARLAGAEQIVAVDTKANKLDYARTFGATDTINSSNATGEEVVERIQELTKGGPDYAFEAIGYGPTILQAYECTRAGGTTVIVGMAPENDEITLNALSIPRTEKVIMGCWYGSAKAWIDLPRMCDLYLAGRLNLDDLVSRSYPLEEINEAYDALAAGDVARSIIEYA
jgi:Zn-dependent alcohol dehydrogenase